YGQLLLFIIPALKSRRWRGLIIFAAVTLVLLVCFGRIALGAHYLTDVLAGMFFGSLWLTFCFFALRPLHRSALGRQIARAATLAEVETVALVAVPVAVPVTETKESAQVLAR